MPYDPSEWRGTLLKVVAGQAANLERIEPGLVLDGTTNDGDQIVLVGPKPGIIQLDSTPPIIKDRKVRENKDYVITLAPLRDDTRDRIVGRDGRDIQYAVYLLVMLTEEEEKLDKSENGTHMRLERKVDAVLHDFQAVFFDDLHLQRNCAGGLVDDATYSVDWSQEVVYPGRLLIVTVGSTLYRLRQA